jgi:hypothetical protein
MATGRLFRTTGPLDRRIVWNAAKRRRRAGGPVTPEITFDELVASLISAGEDVAFYDPNDLTSVYTARTGGANAVADGPVGLMLDKAQMGGLTAAEYLAALDTPELVTNGTFDADSDWIKGTGWTISGGSAVMTSASGDFTQSFALDPDTYYEIKFDFVLTGGSGVRLYFGGITGSSPQLVASSSGSFRMVAKPYVLAISGLGLRPLTGADSGFVDNISVREIPGYHATAPSDAARPILRDVSSTYALDFDNVDDAFAWTTPAITDGTWIALTRDGSYAASAAYSAGTYTMPQFQPFDLCAILWTSADLTTVQEAIVLAEGSARGAAADFGGVTSFLNGFRARTDLRDFPVIDTSNVTNLGQTWYQCTGLTSFPTIDVSSGTNFQSAWALCTSLATFPANMFDSVTATNFLNAFGTTNLTQTSIDNILVSINTANTSGGTFGQTGGSAPSATGEAAIDALRGRGWTVTVTGGY